MQASERHRVKCCSNRGSAASSTGASSNQAVSEVMMTVEEDTEVGKDIHHMHEALQ